MVPIQTVRAKPLRDGEDHLPVRHRCEQMTDVNEDFVAIARREGWYSEALIERIAKEGHVNFPDVPVKWQKVFVTANAIAPDWHVRMQAAFQERCDSAISKTTNFSHAATVEDVRAIYEMAYDMKCKGVTLSLIHISEPT